MKAATRTVVAKTVTAAPSKTPPEVALQLELKRRIAANAEHAQTEKSPSSIKEALMRWLEQEL